MKGHIVKRGERVYALVIELPRDPDGQRRQKWVTVHGTLRTAQARLRELLDDLEHSAVEPQSETMSTVLTDWLDAVAVRVTPKTLARYREIVTLHLVPAFGRIEAQKLSASRIEKYYVEARVSGRADGRGGLAERTILHHHRVLSEAMKRAVRLKIIRSNPCTDVDAPSPKKRQVRAATVDETAALLRAAEGSRIYTPVMVTVCTGLRLGELLGLRWSDVDLAARVLRVEQTCQRVSGQGVSLKATPKTKSSLRSVSLPDVAVRALRRHAVEQKRQRLKAGEFWIENGLVFPALDGRPWSPDSLSHEFSALAKRVGLSLTFHGLRHSHASHLLSAGVHPKIASERLGHSTIAITMDLYSHVLPGEQEKCAAAVDALLGDIESKG